MWVACLASLEPGRATSNLDLTLVAKCVGVSHLPIARTKRFGKWSLILASFLLSSLLQAPCCQLYAHCWPLIPPKKQRLTAYLCFPENQFWGGSGKSHLQALPGEPLRPAGFGVSPWAMTPGLCCLFSVSSIWEEIGGVVSTGALFYSQGCGGAIGKETSPCSFLISSFLPFCNFSLQPSADSCFFLCPALLWSP